MFLWSCARNREIIVFTTEQRVEIVGVVYMDDKNTLDQSFVLRCAGNSKPFYSHDKNFFPGPDWNIGGASSPKIIESSEKIMIQSRDSIVTLLKSSFPSC